MLAALCFALLVITGVTGATGAPPQTSMQVVKPDAQAPPRDGAKEKGTASIKGKVVAADTGKPMRRVQVSLSSPDFSESRSMSTTALGVFEFKDLPPGRYTLSASRPGFLRIQYGQRRPGEPGRPLQIGDGAKITNADFALPRTGAIAGHILDEVGDPLAGASIFAMQWRYFRGKRRLVPIPAGSYGINQTDDTGYFRVSGLDPGDYVVLATTRTTWTVDGKPDERVGYVPTYSGGTTSATEALRVKVGTGQEASVGDLAMVPGRLATVSGTAIYASGQPMAGELLQMTQDFAGPNWTSSFGFSGTRTNPDGSFAITNLPPGEYRLAVRGGSNKDRPPEFASMNLSVADDLSGVMLVGATGGMISGRIITDTWAPLPQAESTRLRVSARPVDPGVGYGGAGDQDNGRVREDWTFELTNVFGQNRISVNPLPAGWALRSIDFLGKDLADVPIDVRGGQRLDGVTIVLSKTLPRVRGTVLDGHSQPIESTVLMFPDESSKWTEESRLVRSARPDTVGGFEFRNVIPGTYLVVPLEYVREGDWTDPEFLENLREGAKRVQVDETGAAGIALTLKKS